MTRAVVVGAGRMGQRHIEVVRSLHLDLVGVADTNPAALEAASRRFDLSDDHLFEHSSDALSVGADCVVVATTAPSHAQLTIEAVEAGASHVLCEKPMATSLAACDAMIDACRSSGVRLAVNHQMRFMEQYRVAREILESPAFGGWASITVVAGNLGLAMNGVHYFELFRWLAGRAPTSVAAWLDDDVVPNPRGPDYVDRAGVVHVQSGDGRYFHLNARSSQGHGIRVVYAGGSGIMVADELGGSIAVSTRVTADRAQPSTRYGCAADERAIAVAPADVTGPTRCVLGALLEGRDWPSGEDGRTALEVLVAAHVSHEQGHRPIDLGSRDVPLDRVFPIA